MNALMRVQDVRNKFAQYLNTECAYLTNKSANNPTVVVVMEHMQDMLCAMLFLQVITQNEANSIGEMIFTEGPQHNITITLSEVTSGRFGLNHEWNLQETDETIIKKYWRARINAFGAKLVQAYKSTHDVCQKHDILDIIIAVTKSGKLTGALTPSECKQLIQCVHKARQQLSGGTGEG